MKDQLRILIVDDDRMMAKTLLDILKVKGYEAEAAHSGREALEKVEKGHFDCLLSDIKMPELNGVELYRSIKARDPELPVVLMTAYSYDELCNEGLKEGAIAVLTKPLDINALLSFFPALQKEQSIVIVDDDPRFCKTLGDILRSRGFGVTQVTDPKDVMETLKPHSQVVLLDMKLNGMNGLDLLKEIRERHPHLPVILVTGYRDEMAQAIEAALEIDAYTCLYKPFQIEELLQLLTEIQHRELAHILGRSA
ncbi:MAG: response regulator [Desulfobacteraceae bacterium]|nr:response regulator [Desulfobacteraceae bacterium]